MAATFDEIVNNMVNVSLGAAAMAADKGKELLDDLSARGAQARSDASASDFSRSMADIFKQAGGAFSEATERLSAQGESVAERILDELIVARVRPMTPDERVVFIERMTKLVHEAPATTVKVPVEVSEDVAAEGTSDDGEA